MDAGGNFVITWTSGGPQDGSGWGVFAQRYDSSGTAVGGEFQVNTYTTANQHHPTVAMDVDGDFVITWTSDGQDVPSHCCDRGVFAQRFMTPTPEQAILDLVENVESMNLQQGIDNCIDTKLNNAFESLEALNADQRNDAVNKLYALINAIDAQRGNKLTVEQADFLTEETLKIIDLIES